jgi:hypothetical protein
MNLQPGRCWMRFLLIAAMSLAILPAVLSEAAAETGAAKDSSSSEVQSIITPVERHDADARPAQVSHDEDENDDEELELAEEPLTEEERLIRETKLLLEELHRLRFELAETRLAKAETQRELDELRRFIEDHDEYGRDFQEYQRIREIRLREQRERERQEARERYERERQQRQERLDVAREMRAERRAAERKEREFRRHGFEPIGMDVFVGRMAYQYRIRDTLRTRIVYDPFFGFFTQRDFRDRIDFTEMILSGAVINTSDDVRNIGIAITFFDRSGNQVGHEIVQVNYARPNVPYPFTSTVSMALDRPFTTSSSYVLYADPADLE